MKILQKQFGIVLMIVVVLIFAGFVYEYATQRSGGDLSDSVEQDQVTLPIDEHDNVVVVENEEGDVMTPITHIVTYLGTEFSPSILTIKKGEIVIFQNESTKGMWPASANHPTHTIYPGSSTSKCGSSEAFMIFDSCEALSNGGEWSFTFNSAGSWGYHNHVSAGHWGTIIVE